MLEEIVQKVKEEMCVGDCTKSGRKEEIVQQIVQKVKEEMLQQIVQKVKEEMCSRLYKK